MSADRIARLHEQASEHYLNGNYQEALQAWRDVLALDPANEQAMDGVRMASQFAQPGHAAAAVSADVAQELDQGLKVFDSLGAKPAPRRPAASSAASPAADPSTGHDPMRQSEGIDFGDLSDVGAIPLGAVDSPELAAPAAAEGEPEAEHAEPDFGLEPVSPTSASAAAVELNRRVADLLAEARAKADAGEKDEALAILSRLAILDDENTEAAALRARLLEGGPSDLDKIEEAIIEGVAALESDRLDDAEGHFQAALALAPEHREAQHYLDKVRERRAGPSQVPGAGHDGEDLLGGDLLGGPAAPEAPLAAPSGLPTAAAVPLAVPAGPPAGKAGASSKARTALPPPEAPVQPRTSSMKLPPLKWVVAAGVLGIAAICAFIAVPQFLSSKKVPAQVPPAPRAAKPPARAAAAPAPVMTAAERTKAIQDHLDLGRARMSSGDFGGAVVAYNEALRLDPANVDAKSGLNEAGDRYKAHKAEEDALNAIKASFRDGEYASALRLAYRLPPSVPEAYVNGVKVAGWYDLAVVALRAGDCREAISHLDEALGAVPGDAQAAQLREFATRYVEAPKDRAFLDQVEALQFRSLP